MTVSPIFLKSTALSVVPSIISRLKSVAMLPLVVTLNLPAWADDKSARVDLSLIEVTPHELALTQVLSEICPPLLNAVQKQKFTESYQIQLQALMPALDASLAMKQINRQREYKAILNDIRRWTLSYPNEENKALCIEFAETQPSNPLPPAVSFKTI